MTIYHLSLSIDEDSDEFWDEVKRLPNKAQRAAKVIDEIQGHLEYLGFITEIDLVRIEE